MLGPLCLPEAKTYWGEGLKGTCGPRFRRNSREQGAASSHSQMWQQSFLCLGQIKEDQAFCSYPRNQDK